MITGTGSCGNIETRYSNEGIQIARRNLESARNMKDSYDTHDLLFKSLEEIKKDPATTLDEKILAQFGIDAIQCIWDRQDNIKINCAIENMVLNAIGAAMPGSMGNALMEMAAKAASLSPAPEDRVVLEEKALNNMALHRGLNILSGHRAATPEETAIKEMGVHVIYSLSTDGGSVPSGQKTGVTGTAAPRDNGELTEKAATALTSILASPLQGSLGMTIAAMIGNLVTDDLSTYTKNCVLGYGIEAIQYSPLVKPVEAALARFSSDTTVHMLDPEYSALVSASVLDSIASQPSDVVYRAMASAVMSAAGQDTSWGDRDRRGVLHNGLLNIAEHKSSPKDVVALAREGMSMDDDIRDDGGAVEAMMKVLKQIELIQTPEESAEAEIRMMVGGLEKSPGATIEIDDEFIDIGGIKLRKNEL